jgi:transcriptional regulator with GAF, ATPase, and Fis domain
MTTITHARDHTTQLVVDPFEDFMSEGGHQRRFDRVMRNSPAPESVYREIAELEDKDAQEKLYLDDEIRTTADSEAMVGQSSALRQVLQLVEMVATSDSTVLLLGETGRHPTARAAFRPADRAENE